MSTVTSAGWRGAMWPIRATRCAKRSGARLGRQLKRKRGKQMAETDGKEIQIRADRVRVGDRVVFSSGEDYRIVSIGGGFSWDHVSLQGDGGFGEQWRKGAMVTV